MATSASAAATIAHQLPLSAASSSPIANIDFDGGKKLAATPGETQRHPGSGAMHCRRLGSSARLFEHRDDAVDNRRGRSGQWEPKRDREREDWWHYQRERRERQERDRERERDRRWERDRERAIEGSGRRRAMSLSRSEDDALSSIKSYPHMPRSIRHIKFSMSQRSCDICSGTHGGPCLTLLVFGFWRDGHALDMAIAMAAKRYERSLDFPMRRVGTSLSSTVRMGIMMFDRRADVAVNHAFFDLIKAKVQTQKLWPSATATSSTMKSDATDDGEVDGTVPEPKLTSKLTPKLTSSWQVEAPAEEAATAASATNTATEDMPPSFRPPPLTDLVRALKAALSIETDLVGEGAIYNIIHQSARQLGVQAPDDAPLLPLALKCLARIG